MSDNRLSQLLNMLKATPKESFLRFAIAKEYEKEQAWNKALEFYQAIHQDDPNYVGLYYHLGKLHEQLEDYKVALATYLEGMEVAKATGDQHALSELAAARLEIDED